MTDIKVGDLVRRQRLKVPPWERISQIFEVVATLMDDDGAWVMLEETADSGPRAFEPLDNFELIRLAEDSSEA